MSMLSSTGKTAAPSSVHGGDELGDAKLERRIGEVEAKSTGVVYRGIFVGGNDYLQNHLVTESGSLWICLRDTHARPGHSSDWMLCAKQGGRG
jgi:hypothetical protein